MSISRIIYVKDNPVNWYSLGNDAVERAKREDKPIILSFGYIVDIF